MIQTQSRTRTCNVAQCGGSTSICTSTGSTTQSCNNNACGEFYTNLIDIVLNRTWLSNWVALTSLNAIGTHSKKTSQELRMLSSITINCQVTKIVNFKICQQVTTMAFGSLPLQPPQFHDISNCLYKRKHRYMQTAKSHHSFFNSLTISTSLTFITRLLDIHFHILHPFSFIGHQCHQTYHHGHQSH